MVFLETALESKLNPLVALGRAGSMGLSGFVNKFNADAELLDDLVRIRLPRCDLDLRCQAYVDSRRTIIGRQNPTRCVGPAVRRGASRGLRSPWAQKERNWLIEQLQKVARSRRVRVTFLSGDVHCAAVGVLKTLVKSKKDQEVPPPMDFRYMLNVVTSACLS